MKDFINFVALLQAIIIVSLVIRNVSLRRKTERLKEQLRSLSLEMPHREDTEEMLPLPVLSSVVEEDNVNYTSESVKDKELFERINQTIIEDKLFLDPDFSRDKFIKVGLINKNKVGQLLQQYANTNLNGYINNLRLEYALTLIRTQPDVPVKAVAIDSGFNNPRTFYRLFQAKYGMTPVEYKESLHG